MVFLQQVVGLGEGADEGRVGVAGALMQGELERAVQGYVHLPEAWSQLAGAFQFFEAFGCVFYPFFFHASRYLAICRKVFFFSANILLFHDTEGKEDCLFVLFLGRLTIFCYFCTHYGCC